MAVKITIKVGGLIGSTVWDATAQSPAFGEDSDPMYQAGMACDNGRSCQYEFTVHDDVGDIPRANLTKNTASHNIVTISEDAPGFEAWLSRGMIADKGWGRDDKPFGDARAGVVRVDDSNIELRGLALVADWVRPAESGRARVLAALAAFCNASPRLDTVIDDHLVAAGGEVNMPAKTYQAGTDLPEIFTDCATMEGKVFSVVIHHVASVSHLCFLYVDEGDHTTYLSTLSITDTSPNLTTSFPPMWDQGDATIESGGDVPVSHVVSRYGQADSNYVVSSDATIVDAYNYWAASYNDSVSVNAAQAVARAAAVRHSWRTEHVTHQVTIKLRADQVHLLCAGMSIAMRSAAAMSGQYLGTSQTRRIAQLKWELVAPDVGAVDGYYLAHMQLDRPIKLIAMGKGLPPGPKPATAGVPFLVDVGVNTTNGSDAIAWDHGSGTGNKDLTIDAGHADRALYIFVMNGHADATPTPVWRRTGPIDEALTLIAGPQTAFGATGTINVFRLLSPTPGVGQVTVTNASAVRVGGFYVTGVNQSSPEADTDVDNPIGLTSAGVTVSGGALYLDVAGMVNAGEVSVGNPTPSGSQTQAWSVSFDSASANDSEFGGSSGDPTPVWTSASSRMWVAAAVAVNGTGGTTEPVGGTGTGTPGTPDGTFVGPGHVHEHGNITTGGPYHMAEDVTTVPFGTIAATNVQAALEEVVAEATSGAPTTADYLVGTAQGGLSAEIVVGTTPGGELGNTWASPTVDATHGGSNHLQPVRKNSAGTVFTRRQLNLIEGSNVTLTVADDAGNDEVDITIAASGGGGLSDQGTFTYLDAAEAAAPATPAAGKVRVYAKTDGLLYSKDDAGVETVVTGGAASTADHDHTTAGGDGGDLDGARIGDFTEYTEVSAPSTPASGLVRVYAKSDGHLYQKDDAGTETDLAAAGGGSGALTFLSQTVLGSAAADITITGLSGSYKDLVIVVRGRSTDAGAGIGLDMRVGSGSIDTGSTYSYQQTYVGWASGNNTSTGATSARIGSIPNSGATAGSFGVCIIEITNYADTAKWRGWVGQAFAHDGSGVLRSEVGGFWKNAAAALDQVRVLGSAGNLDTGSALTIYGRG